MKKDIDMLKESSRRLRQILQEKDMKQQELSDKSGVSKASISQYMNGDIIPSNVSAGKMATVLDVNPVWLMGYDIPREMKSGAEQAAKDFDFFQKYSSLTERDKQIVMDLMNSMLSNYDNGAD